MLRWKQKMAKYSKIGPYGVAAGAIIAWAVIWRLLLLLLHYPEANSDEGTMGIEAMHIAFQGQHPIYLYGQNYMGVLEAYLAAPFFHLFGVSVLTLRIGMLLMFGLFMLAMYWLGSLLYSKRLALVTLALLSLATSDMLIQQLRAVGGAIETILFGSLMLVLAYRLAASVRQRGWWRYLAYLAWGLSAGVALWVHVLVLPFVLCSGLLILIFCYRDWYTLALPCLLLGFCIGAYPLLQNYHLVLDTVLKIRSGGNVVDPNAHTNLLQQMTSTLLWGMPLTTGVQPICAIADLPTYGPGDALTLPCSLLQGAWSAGYLLLLGTGLFLAARVCWRITWRRLRRRERSAEDAPQALQHFARLMHLLTAVLVIGLYVGSPLSGLKPVSTRYLVGLLVATPGILWPLWHLADLENRRVSFKAFARWLSRIRLTRIALSRAVLIFAALVVFSGTIATLTTVPAAYANAQQQQKLVQDLLNMHIRRVYLEYWTCYRLLFQSQEQILCATPPYPQVVGADRYAPDARAVQPDSKTINPAIPFMFPADASKEIAAFEQYNQEHHKRFQKHILDGMVLYIPLAP
jgi:hypothetical protein